MYDKIAELCEKNNVSGYRLCKDIGIQPSILTDLKKGRQKGLSASNAEKVASYFGVSVAYLLGEEPAEKEKTPDNVGGLKAAGYDKLTPENRAVIDDLIAKLVKGQSSQ